MFSTQTGQPVPDAATHERKKPDWIAILGNPNSGKTATFNRLTGLHLKLGNYPGTTVEVRSGKIRGTDLMARDFPGAYSLNPKSLDEKIVADVVQSWRSPAERPRAVLVILDATNLTRNLYLALQILDWGLPTIIVLNMIDETRKRNIHIDAELLRARLHAHAVIPASAKTGEGMDDIIRAIHSIGESQAPSASEPRLAKLDGAANRIATLTSYLETFHDVLQLPPLVDSMRLVAEDNYLERIKPLLQQNAGEEISRLVSRVRDDLRQNDIHQALEPAARYAFIDNNLAETISDSGTDRMVLSERIDAVLTHRIWGPVGLLVLLGVVFNFVFLIAQYPMAWIESGVAWTSTFASSQLPPGMIKSLLVDGVLAGVGNVIVFLPQIVMLVFFLTLLEDSGYMARMAFMLDRPMSKVGLHGRSVLPMLNGFACAIPAIMAARTIEDWRDRLATILLIPLTSCSARLPVYTLFVSAFFSAEVIYGFISLRAIVFFAVYFLGAVTAIVLAWAIKKIWPHKSASQFVMELPPYRMPMLRTVAWQVVLRARAFLTDAGSIILAVTVILWFLASYPIPEGTENMSAKEKIEHSYAGRVGHAIEPVLRPLGFDWKIGVGLIASFAAREVIISTLATLYNVGEDGEENVALADAMKNDRYADGHPVFTPLVALSLVVFFVYAAQCMATLAIVRRETGSWRWPLVMFCYMTTLAFISSMMIFQVGRALGWG